MPDIDAVIVGAGPNGLAAAIKLAQAGQSVLICEAKDTIGGGSRTQELTLPGYLHDVCSAIHPLAIGSPFLKTLPLEKFGVEWIHPPLTLAHPFDDGTAVQIAKSLDDTVAMLDGDDGKAYRHLVQPFVERWDDLAVDALGPLKIPPRHPLLLAWFGLQALWPATSLVRARFKSPRTRAMFLGMAAHACLPLNSILTASFGMMLSILSHAVGWPISRGGSQTITNAMAKYLETLGGKIITGQAIHDISELPSASAILLDLTPKQILQVMGDRLSSSYRRQLENYRYGMGVFKLDMALSGPIPWTAQACKQAGTVHLGSTSEEIIRSEEQVWRGQHADRPYMIVAQQSLFDASRAPNGNHTCWAYAHMPFDSTADQSEVMVNQIERFAPGFRDLIIAKHSINAHEMSLYNPNYVGGDINGGVQDIRQLFTRPVFSLVPYRTSAKGVYICSSATPPGGGVHGMCGYHAAEVALRDAK